MATIVNTPAHSDSSSGMGTMMMALVLLLAVVLFFVYGLPAIRGAAQVSAPQVNIPSDAKLDVNVNSGQGGQK